MTDHARRPASSEPLRHLPTPEHGPTFWADLDARLSQQDDATVALAPNPPPPPIPTAPPLTVPAEVSEAPLLRDGGDRRSARFPRSALLVAAAIVALVGVTIVRTAVHDRAEHHVMVTNPSPTTGVSSPAAEAKAEAVAWLDALSHGDMRIAWDHLGPAARGSWSTYDQFAAGRTEFSEGLATWANADDLNVGAVALDSTSGPATFVVTLTGTRHVEGMDETGGIPMLVQQTATGGYTVEPFFPAGSTGAQLEIQGVGNAAQISPDTPVTLTAPPGGRLILVLDRDQATVTPSRTAMGAASYRPPGGWTPGRHTVTAVITGTPAPLADVIVFDVAPPESTPSGQGRTVT